VLAQNTGKVFLLISSAKMTKRENSSENKFDRGFNLTEGPIFPRVQFEPKIDFERKVQFDRRSNLTEAPIRAEDKIRVKDKFQAVETF
jgi:hypothetical protein